ncbi:MAG TPA: response regulator transcription factor [Chloroflexia bacterium]|nr:response regulator transcription factor [Chloroflexia bacterium]
MERMQPIRVVLADDHPFVRAGIRATLAAEHDVALIGEAADGEEARRLCCELKPDVLLLDLDMPGHRPVETVSYMQEHCANTKVLVLTAYDDDTYVRALVAIGVQGYVLKDEAPETVVQAIRTVTLGGMWFSQSVLAKMAKGKPSPALSDRERELLSLVALGWDNQRIAGKLGLAGQTVRNYLSQLYQKLGLGSKSEAIVWAREHNLDQIDKPS